MVGWSALSYARHRETPTLPFPPLHATAKSTLAHIYCFLRHQFVLAVWRKALFLMTGPRPIDQQSVNHALNRLGIVT